MVLDPFGYRTIAIKALVNFATDALTTIKQLNIAHITTPYSPL